MPLPDFVKCVVGKLVVVKIGPDPRLWRLVLFQLEFGILKYDPRLARLLCRLRFRIAQKARLLRKVIAELNPDTDEDSLCAVRMLVEDLAESSGLTERIERARKELLEAYALYGGQRKITADANDLLQCVEYRMRELEAEGQTPVFDDVWEEEEAEIACGRKLRCSRQTTDWNENFCIFGDGTKDSRERTNQGVAFVAHYLAAKRRGMLDFCDVPAPSGTEPGDDNWWTWLLSRAENINLTRSAFSYGHSLLATLDTDAKVVAYLDTRKDVVAPSRQEWTLGKEVLPTLVSLANEDTSRVKAIVATYASRCHTCSKVILGGSTTGHHCKVLAAIAAAAPQLSSTTPLPTLPSPSSPQPPPPTSSRSQKHPSTNPLVHPITGRKADSGSGHTQRNRDADPTFVTMTDQNARREEIYYPWQLIEHAEVDFGFSPDALPPGWQRLPTRELLLQDLVRLQRFGYSSISPSPSDLGYVYFTASSADPRRRTAFLVHQAFVKLILRLADEDEDSAVGRTFGRSEKKVTTAAAVFTLLAKLDRAGTSLATRPTGTLVHLKCGNAPPSQCTIVGIRMDVGERLHFNHVAEAHTDGQTRVVDTLHRFPSFLSLPRSTILFVILAEWDFAKEDAVRKAFVRGGRVPGEVWVKGMRLR